MATILSPNMSLPVPTVGSEAGPQYATDVNNCLNILDAHDHSPGYGTPVSPAGLNINSDLSFISNNATDLRSVRLSVLSAAPATASDINCIYDIAGDLYFTDSLGNNIRITQSGAVAGTPGSIANLVSPASASYSAAAKTFTFQSDTLKAANLDAGSIVLRNIVTSSPGLTLSPPTLSGDYTITLPALPASTLPVSISSTGVMTAAQITLAQLSAAVQAAIAAIPLAVPTGSMLAYGGTSAPTGYLLCDGSAVSRTTYADLFAAVGTSNGSGDGSTTFNLPDARGRFIRGVDGAAGRDPDSASRTAANSGGNTGNNVGSAQLDAFQDHKHANGAGTGGNIGIPAASNGISPFTDTLTASSGRSSTETRPQNIYQNFIIKT